jgi:HK97 gp10 family phage protein
MAGDGFKVEVRGLADVQQALRDLAPKLRKRAILNALRASGRVFRDEARRLTPVLAVPVYRANGMVRRAPGTVRKAISVRTSKASRRKGDLGVFVNVKPAKGALRGANKPFDPFYWRWLEFGARGRPGVGMLQKAASKAGEAVRRFGESLGPQVQRLNKKDAQP